MLIAGDIGGTKTDLAIYSAESGPRAPLAQTEVHSADYASLQAIVAEFLGTVDISVEVGSFAVAGPVIAGHVKTTRLDTDPGEPTVEYIDYFGAEGARLLRVKLYAAHKPYRTDGGD